MKRFLRAAVFFAAFVLVTGAGARAWLKVELENRAIVTKPKGTATPLQFGAPYRSVEIRSGDRRLDSFWVSAGNDAPAMLILHGRGESISDWARVQALLFRNGVSSLVVDYSGFGASTGSPSVERLDEDARATYAALTRLHHSKAPRLVFGHSLGSGVLLSTCDEFAPPPRAIIIHGAHSSARDAVVHLGLLPQSVAAIVPDLWNNVEAAARLRLPLLVMHSDSDEVIPASMARKIANASRNSTFVELHGRRHNDIYLDPREADWRAVIALAR